MKKLLSIFLVFCLSFVYTYSIADATDKYESGEIKSHFSDLGVSASILFSKNGTRALTTTVIFADCQDELGGSGPLPFDMAKSLIKYSSWLGITEDQKDLILIGYFNEKESIIILDYNPKGVIKYNIMENDCQSDAEFIAMLPDLFSSQNVSEYYEVLSEEVIEQAKAIGVKNIEERLK